MNKFLGFVTKHQNGLALGIATVACLAATAISLAWDKKRHEAEMETQRMLQEKIRRDMAKANDPKPEES